MIAARVAWPVLRALRAAILAGERAVNAVPDPDPRDPLGGVIATVVLLALGVFIGAGCAVAHAILYLIETQTP